MNEITTNISKKELALINAGATREVAYKTMVDGLSALTITVDKFGVEHESPDTSNRLKSAEMIARLHGDLKTDVVVDNRQVKISVGADAVKELLGMVADVKEQMEMLRTDGRQTGEIIDV